MCGYSARSVSGDSHADALDEVCGLHSAVAGVRPPATGSRLAPGRMGQAVRTFELAREAPRAARHFVVDTLRLWGDGALADDAAVIAAELATNAVRHARTDFAVAVARSPDSVRISVHDGGTIPAADGGSPLAAAAGHGLGVVAAVASRWAAEPVAGGKTVWAELR